MDENKDKEGKPWIVLALAFLIVFVLSFVPWHSLTGGAIKDFNLFSDITVSGRNPSEAAANEIIDPELLTAMQEMDSLQSQLADSTMEIRNDTIFLMPNDGGNPGRVNGEMVIEDYTLGTRGLFNLNRALRNGGKARIAVIGDSYIEGDIFTQDIRLLLQEKYGGRGVGYVPAFSNIPGFRRSVNVNGNDAWAQHSISKGKADYYALASEYFVGQPGAAVKYHGYSRNPKIAAWNSSSVMFIAPAPGKITLINDTDTLSLDVEANAAPQFATLAGETSKFTVKSSVPGLVFLGAWLEDRNGVTVDCMSVRGDSGISHKRINSALAELMRSHIDYDLIIIEYGINALSSQQTDYSGYARLMAEVIKKLQECYPNSDILIMGVGDRGQKAGGEVHSLHTIDNMVMNQRRLASETGTLFWDTREAMGGTDAIVDWRERKLVNGDFIHLNADGGRELATLLVNSINAKLHE